MRIPVVAVLVAAATLLAGCTVPEEGPEQDPLFGLCPQWAQGPGRQALDLDVSGNASTELGPANETHVGHDLDLYRITVDDLEVDGRLELRARAADGRQLGIRDYRIAGSEQIVPVVAFEDGSAAGHEFDVFLSPVSHAGEASPAPVTLHWTTTGNATVEGLVTFHYKVCGAPV